jgi:alcohol dehydrogenase (cytochrome c)
MCTSVSGGKIWMAGSYNPQTETYYIPLTEACNTVTANQTEFTAGNSTGSMSFGPRVLPEGITDAGLLEALSINPTQGDHKWQHRQRTSMSSSTLTTGGGLVFAGDAGRNINAFDADTGELLWQQRLNAPVGGSPMTYELDGEQYLVVPTGYVVQASSAAAMFPEVPLPTGAGNSIFVFKLSTPTN